MQCSVAACRTRYQLSIHSKQHAGGSVCLPAAVSSREKSEDLFFPLVLR